MGTKARVPRLDGAETEAGSRQRAKASQEQKEHPISKEAQLETQEKGPSTAFISSLLPKPCSQGTLLLSPPLKKKKKKLATHPLATLRWGPIYSPAGRTARMSGVSPRVEKGERTVYQLPPLQLLPQYLPQPPWALHTRLSCPGWDLTIQGSASRLHGPLPDGWRSP